MSNIQELSDDILDITKEDGKYIFKAKVTKGMQDALKIFENDKEIQNPKNERLTENLFFRLFRKMKPEVKSTILNGNPMPIDRKKIVLIDGKFYKIK